MIPWEIWATLIAIAIIGTAYSWRIRDDNNYTDIITGFVAVVFWLIAGISLFGTGVVTQTMAYANSSMAWMFIAVGIIQALIVFIGATDLWHK
ncbi:hypothetical protein SAMN04488589_0619 [Methanolobus vulcani]|uniref:Uncharacterized protein n=1 Tax=Methanolobus vulcani TaxID=38026 RepID=A0A7Z7AUY3_9EURY|nr:hypothetical protein [Methanolobus vulcani]SDF47036.1 hypothetical protein SAMN04488589_0619 [Methanolobus vulcani]